MNTCKRRRKEMKRLAVIGIAVAVMSTSIAPVFSSPIKEREWLEGKLLDIGSAPYTYGSVVNGTGGVHQGERITYRIDDGKYVYTASHTHRRRDKALPLTVNDKIKFALEKDKVYILDEDGKEHELKFVKKTLKESEK
jgi:hypothetical protein